MLTTAGHRAQPRRLSAPALTGRELDVLVLLVRGLTNRQMARSLGVSPKTVSNHVEHIYAKIDVSSRAAATLFAIENGLLGSHVVAR